MGIDRDVARRSASHKFGEMFYWWYALPHVMGYVLRVVSAIVVGAAMVWGWLYAADHMGAWLDWLGLAFTVYLLPSILIVIGIVIYAAGAGLAWYHWGWLWKFKGIGVGAYTAMSCSLMVVFITLVGVAL